MIFKKSPMDLNINGESFFIKTDFRDWVQFEKTINQYAETEEEKITNLAKAIDFILDGKIPDVPLNLLVDGVLNFYSCSDDWKTIKTGKSSGNAVFDYEYDSLFMYSAFKEQYGIDLEDIEYLHWWKFRAMFRGLKNDCKLSEIIGYRAIKIDGKMPKSQRDFYNEMKKTYAIPISQELIHKDDELIEALKNGGDISEIIKR